MTEAKFLLDAHLCIYLLNGSSEILRARVEQLPRGTAATSAISFADVMIGVGIENRRNAERFFTTIAVLPFDRRCGDAYAALPFKRNGFDRLIAAHALALDLTLVTNNERDFTDIPGLRVENWTR